MQGKEVMTMSEVGEALAVAIKTLEEFLASVDDPDLTKRIQRTKASMRLLQLELDELMN
jgi:hypothetical protein